MAFIIANCQPNITDVFQFPAKSTPTRPICNMAVTLMSHGDMRGLRIIANYTLAEERGGPVTISRQRRRATALIPAARVGSVEVPHCADPVG